MRWEYPQSLITSMCLGLSKENFRHSLSTALQGWIVDEKLPIDRSLWMWIEEDA